MGHFPQSMPTESFLESIDGVALSIRTHFPSSSGGRSPCTVKCRQGRLFLSAYRAVFVEQNLRFNFSMPFVMMSDVELRQKFFHRECISGVVFPVASQGLAEVASFKLKFSDRVVCRSAFRQLEELSVKARLRGDSERLFSQTHRVSICVCRNATSVNPDIITTTLYLHPTVICPVLPPSYCCVAPPPAAALPHCAFPSSPFPSSSAASLPEESPHNAYVDPANPDLLFVPSSQAVHQ